MSLGWTLGEYAYGEDPESDAYSAIAPGFAALTSPTSARIWAAEIAMALGSNPASTTTLRVATEAFSTAATDSPASTPFDGRLASAYLSRALDFASDGRLTGGTVKTEGRLVISASDGSLDATAADYEVDGRTVQIRAGDRLASGAVRPYRDFPLAFKGSAVSWDLSRESVRIPLRDLGVKLRSTIATTTYAGTGALEGTEEMAGLSRPQAYGYCYQVNPQLVIPSAQVWQFHDQEATDVLAVYDGGIVLEKGPDYPTYASMMAAEPPAGGYVTCLKRGLFRLASDPAKTITADVIGDRAATYRITVQSWSDGTLWSDGTAWAAYQSKESVDTHAGIIWRILQDRAGMGLADIDSQSFQDFDEIQPGLCGYWLPAGTDKTIEAAIGEVASAAGGFVGPSRFGPIAIRRLEAPQGYAFVTLDMTNVIRDSLERVSDLPYGVPWWDWRAWFQRTWFQQQQGSLNGGVSPQFAARLSRPGRVQSAQDQAVRDRHPTSKTLSLYLLLVEQADALAEVTRLRGLYAPGRVMVQGQWRGIAYQLDLGDTVLLRHDRFGLSGGRYMTVLGVDEDGASNRTSLTLFG